MLIVVPHVAFKKADFNCFHPSILSKVLKDVENFVKSNVSRETLQKARQTAIVSRETRKMHGKRVFHVKHIKNIKYLHKIQ